MIENNHAIVFSGFLPTFALTYIILVPMFYDFKEVTRTHCVGTKNVLPSVSAAIGYSAQTTVIWFLCIALHTPFRVQLAKIINNLYKKMLSQIYDADFLLGLSLQELRQFKKIERYTKISYWFNIIEIIGLLVLSIFSSSGDYEMHKNGFCMYLFGSAGFTICTCLIERDLKKKNMFNSYKIRLYLAATYFVSTFASIGLFYWHNTYCTNYAQHQTGHNSGVIHAGIYYTPGSLKAKLCVEGLEATYAYCDEHSIPYKKCGKLIVAVNQEEANRLDGLFEKGLQNKVRDLRLIDGKEIKSIEPNCKGLKAIHSPHTGIVDWGFVARHFGKMYQKHGGNIKLNFNADEFTNSTEPDYPIKIVSTDQEVINAKYMISCGGLQADKISKKTGCNELPKIVPFRGDYLVLKPHKTNMIKGNIYPVPNPNFPFLGVHFTPRMDGSVWLGPNAVLSFKREGYKITDFDLKDAIEELSFSGLQKLALKNLKAGLGEMYRGVNIAATVRELQKFVPVLKTCDVIRGPSGVRAQALDADGKLVDDFIFDSGTGNVGKRMLHVRNAPSPAATSSLAIANVIAEECTKRFNLKPHV